MKDHPSRVVTVEIHGQRYSIRSQLEATYVAELAAYLDEKMRLAARETSAADSLKIAVLAALNITDEYFRAREGEQQENGRLLRRAEELERLIDLALGDQPRQVVTAS